MNFHGRWMCWYQIQARKFGFLDFNIDSQKMVEMFVKRPFASLLFFETPSSWQVISIYSEINLFWDGLKRKVHELTHFFFYFIAIRCQVVPWRNGEDAGLVFQGSVIRALAQEIFHSNSGLLSFTRPETVLWTIAKYYYYYLVVLKGRKIGKTSKPR